MPIFSTKKTVIVVVGPTAVGKTAAAIELAKHFKTEIISADSRQCYKELNIAVARPSADELKQVVHHFIATHSIHDEVTAAGFGQYALQKANEIFLQHDVVVMVGGTGLYIKAFCEGLDMIPEVPEEIRNDIINKYKERGIEWLRSELQINDPEFFHQGEIKNPQRMMRALEVKLATGNSIIQFRKGKKVKRDFNIIKIGLQLPKEELYARINNRTEEMIKEGLVKEAEALSPNKHLNALQTVGYKEIFDYLNNNISLSKAIELIKQHTRQYAKRQITWFKKDNEVNWIDHSNINNLLSVVAGLMNN